MGMKSKSGHFGGAGAGGPSKKIGNGKIKVSVKAPIFYKNCHVTFNSISARREFFLRKSAARLEHELHKHGYETERKPSTHKGSRAKFIITLNPSKDRNISQIQVSSGSKRHGNVPYVKISTYDIGKIKIIGSDSKSYKTDGNEKAKILFRRKKNESFKRKYSPFRRTRWY